jgi:para-nitrobenzyl esterase
LFTWSSPALNGILGACHALEIGFVFGTIDDQFCGTGPEAEKLSEKIQEAWVTFARTGNPSCNRLGKWLPYGQNRTTMILGKACSLEDDPMSEERKAWNKLDFIMTKPI